MVGRDRLQGSWSRRAAITELPLWMKDLLKRLRPYLVYGSYEVHFANGRPEVIGFQFKFSEQSYKDLMKVMKA